MSIDSIFVPDFIKSSVVTREVHQEATKRFFQKSDGIIILKTPEDDSKILEETLEIPALGDTFIKVPKDAKHCACCGRQYSFLDITNVGINIHGKDFVKNFVTGAYGHIWNRTVPTGITCYNCKKRGEVSASYYFKTYVCI